MWSPTLSSAPRPPPRFLGFMCFLLWKTCVSYLPSECVITRETHITARTIRCVGHSGCKDDGDCVACFARPPPPPVTPQSTIHTSAQPHSHQPNQGHFKTCTPQLRPSPHYLQFVLLPHAGILPPPHCSEPCRTDSVLDIPSIDKRTAHCFAMHPSMS